MLGARIRLLFRVCPIIIFRVYTDNQFDKFEFKTGDDKTQTVEGHLIKINYDINDNAPAVSGLQVVRNYTNAIKKVGGQIIYEWEDGGYQCSVMKVVKSGMEIWAYVESAGKWYVQN